MYEPLSTVKNHFFDTPDQIQTTGGDHNGGFKRAQIYENN